MAHLLPHWNWSGREGQAIPVVCYTNTDEVELFLNAKSLGRKRHDAEPMVLPVGINVSKDKTFYGRCHTLLERCAQWPTKAASKW